MTDSLSGGQIEYNPVWLTNLLQSESINTQMAEEFTQLKEVMTTNDPSDLLKVGFLE